MIKICKILSPHGVKGLIKIISLASNPEDIFKYDLVDEKGKKIKLERKFSMKDSMFVCHPEICDTYDKNQAHSAEPSHTQRYNPVSMKTSSTKINTRLIAESLSGFYLFTDPSNLPKLSIGEFYSYELIGVDVIANEKKIGVVSDVKTYSGINAVFLEIKINGKNLIQILEYNEENFPSILNEGRLEKLSGDKSEDNFEKKTNKIRVLELRVNPLKI